MKLMKIDPSIKIDIYSDDLKDATVIPTTSLLQLLY